MKIPYRIAESLLAANADPRVVALESALRVARDAMVASGTYDRAAQRWVYDPALEREVDRLAGERDAVLKPIHREILKGW